MARLRIRKVTERQEGRWWYQRWNDGTEQWCIPTGTDKKASLYVERVLGPKSKRKFWCVVDRGNPGTLDNTVASLRGLGLQAMDTSKYPKSVAGPFDDLNGAKTALLMLLTT